MKSPVGNEERDICNNETMSLIRKLNPIQGLVLSFGLLILTGTILLCIPISWENEQHVHLIDALFTAASAVCVTGLVVVDTPGTYSTFGEVVILLLIQFGALGIITFASVFLVLMGQEISYQNKLILKESFSLKSPGQVKNLALTIIKLTLSIEIIGAALLTFFFIPQFGTLKSLYFAVFHSVSAFCNAGFSLFSNNLESFTGHPGVNITIMLLIILGGLGFPVLVELLSFKKRSVLSIRARVVLITSAFLIFGGALILHLFAIRLGGPAYYNLPTQNKILACLFQSVTARTAGFSSINLHVFPVASLIVLIALMFIGGSPAGTAGGIKTTTFWIILAGAWHYLRGEERITAWHKEINLRSFQRAIVLAMAAFILVASCIGILVYFGSPHHGVLDYAFEAVSAFGTVGLSLGITPELNSLQKLIIIALMFIGRVGPISFAYFFVLRRKPSGVRYPQIEIPIG